MSNTDPRGLCVDADGDGRCDRSSDGLQSWEQLYAKYPYYAFRREWEANWEAKGWTPGAAEAVLNAYETFLMTPDRYVSTTNQHDQYVYADAYLFSYDFLGEYLVFDESMYQRRFETLKSIIDRCNGNVSGEVAWAWLAMGGAAFGIDYTMPMYDADDRIGGGGNGGATSNLRGKALLDDLFRRGEPGNRPHVKLIYGEDASEISNNLADAGSIKSHRAIPDGLQGTIDGEYVGYRPYSSKSAAIGNPPTIDVAVPGSEQIEFKFMPGTSRP